MRRTPRAAIATPPCSRSTTLRSAPARRMAATPPQGNTQYSHFLTRSRKRQAIRIFRQPGVQIPICLFGFDSAVDLGL